MATYFGEILPEVTRAYDEEEDWDEEASQDDESERLTVKWETVGITSVRQRFLVIADGEPITDFVGRCLVPGVAQEVGRLMDGETTIATFREASCDVMICSVKPGIRLECLYEFSEKVVDLLDKSLQPEVTVLTCQPLSLHLHNNSGSSAVLVRTLHTSSLSRGLPTPHLEQPNVLSGIPATVLTLCEMRDIPAVALVTFLHPLEVDSSVASVLTNELSQCVTWWRPDIYTPNFPHRARNHGNMYL